MIKILCVGMGGFLGAVSRYLVSIGVQRFFNNHWFPFGTLTVNVIGCLLIGFCAGILESKHIGGDAAQLFLIVGLLGGFTTFSSFSYETITLMRNAHIFSAFLNVALQIIICLGASYLGYYASKYGIL